MLRILATQEEIDVCRQYSKEASEHDDEFKLLGLQLQTRILNRYFSEKMGVVGTRKYFLSKGHRCSEINFSYCPIELYAPDLIVDGKTICHVKATKHYDVDIGDLTWLFDLSTPLIKSRDVEIFNSYPSDLVSFCMVSNHQIDLFAIIPSQILLELELYNIDWVETFRGKTIRQIHGFSIPQEYWIPNSWGGLWY